jgi:hypothetical protein
LAEDTVVAEVDMAAAVDSMEAAVAAFMEVLAEVVSTAVASPEAARASQGEVLEAADLAAVSTGVTATADMATTDTERILPEV